MLELKILNQLSEILSELNCKIDSIQESIDKLNAIKETESESNNEPFIDVAEACSILKIEKSTLYTLCCKRKIPSYKLGKYLMFKRTELEELMNKSNRKVKDYDFSSIMKQMQAGVRHRPKGK